MDDMEASAQGTVMLTRATSLRVQYVIVGNLSMSQETKEALKARRQS